MHVWEVRCQCCTYIFCQLLDYTHVRNIGEVKYMNKRIKKKIKHWSYTTAKTRKRNKALCERYPFLIPRYYFVNEVCWMRKKYDNTIVESFPRGWWKSFGILLCEDLREELIRCNFLKQYRIIQLKEKYGQLRIYDNGLADRKSVV